MDRRCAADRDHLVRRPDEREGEIEGVDRLADEDAAAVARMRAAAGLVVVALRPPPGNDDAGRGDRAERAALELGGEPFRDRPEPVLEDDSQGHARSLGGRDDLRRRRRGPLDRFLHQDVLAPSREAPHEFHADIGRGQQHRVVDGRVVDDPVEVIRHREPEPLREGVATAGRRAVRSSHLHPISKVGEALRMGGDRHPEPDNRAPHHCPLPAIQGPPWPFDGNYGRFPAHAGPLAPPDAGAAAAQ